MSVVSSTIASIMLWVLAIGQSTAFNNESKKKQVFIYFNVTVTRTCF